jgi:hypothetical protein
MSADTNTLQRFLAKVANFEGSNELSEDLPPRTAKDT